MEAYGKKASGTSKEKMTRHSGRRPCPNGSWRLEKISLGPIKIEGFSYGGDNSLDSIKSQMKKIINSV